MADVVTKELKVRAYVDAQTGQLKVFEADMDKVGKAVDAATKKVQAQEKVLDRQNKALNNTRDSLIRSQFAFGGLSQAAGGAVGNLLAVTNQIEDFEYQAKRSGQSINLFQSSVGQATGAIGKLGVASLVAGAAVGGWKIGTWIANQELFGKKIGQTTDYLMDLSGMAKEDEDRLRAMNDQLAQSLWDKYGIQVKMAGLSILEANKALLAAASSANMANIAIGKALKDINTNAANLSNDFLLQQMSAADRLVEIERQKGELRVKLQGSISQKYIDQYKNEIMQLDALASSSTAELLTEQASAGRERTAELKRQQKEREELAQKHAEQMVKYEAEAAARAFEYQKNQAEASADLLRDQMAEEARANNERKEAAEQAAENLNNAVLDAALERIEREKAALAELAAYEKQNQLDRLAQWSSFFGQIGQLIGGVSGGAFTAVGSGISAYGQVLEKVFNKEKDLFGNSLTTANAWAGGIAGVFSSLASQIEGTAGQILGAIGAIAAGFAQGGVWGAVIAGVGVLANALASLFGKDWEAEAKKTTQAVYDFIGALALSEDFMQRFTEAAKESGDAVTTFQLMLKDVIDDLGGINIQNADQIFTLARDLISAFDGGKISAQEFSKAFGAAFKDLADFAMEYGGVYKQQLMEMINLTRQLGVEIPEVTQFLSEQLDKLIADVNTFASKFEEIVTRLTERAKARMGDLVDESLVDGFLNEAELNRIKQGWEKLGAFVGATIAEMIAQGRSWGEIMQQLGPSIETLLETAERFGFQAKGAFAELLNILKMMEGAADNFERLDLMGGILDSLALFGRLGPKYIGDFFGQVKKTFAELLGYVGGDWQKKLTSFLTDPFEKWTDQQKTAFQAIIPYILQAAQYYEQMGLPLPPMLQQLLDIAKAQGFITDTAPKPDPFEQIGIQLEKLNLNMENFLLMLQQMAGMVIPITFDIETRGEIPGFIQKGPTQFAAGPPTMITYPQNAKLDTGDVVIPPRGRNGRSNFGGTELGGNKTTNVYITVTDPDELRLLEIIRRWERDGIH